MIKPFAWQGLHGNEAINLNLLDYLIILFTYITKKENGRNEFWRSSRASCYS